MYLQIKALVLWPRNNDRGPRVLPFKLGVVNVISGLSKKGKSAVIPIVDYCLGADKCAIPVATIRQACSWFGLILETRNGEMLLARREPGSQKSTNEMYVAVADRVDIPGSITKGNSNTDQTKATLNEMAGLTRLDFDTDELGLAFRERPSFRDMMAFVFQPQNIIANPNVLFYKADTTEHREKLKAIFPYVLGAVPPEALALMHERARLRLDIRRRERELDAIRQVSARWMAEIRAKVSRAHELGLISTPPQQDATVTQLVQVLRNAVHRSTSGDFTAPTITGTAVNAVTQELVALEREERQGSEALSQLKKRLEEMERLRAATSEFRGSLGVRRSRLEISDWLAGMIDEERSCPMCGSHETVPADKIATLQRSLRTIEAQASAIDATPAAFDRESERVRRDLDIAVERVNAIRSRRRTMQAESAAARARLYETTESARFIGGLEEALSRFDQIASDGDLAAAVELVRARLDEIERRLRVLDTAGAVKRMLERFTLLASRILPQLNAEWPDDPVHLVLEELTLSVSGPDRENFLWEIGSGANWLAYHIATSLALHQLFRTLSVNHVPTFAIYDQPSQVYFPRQIVASSVESGDLIVKEGDRDGRSDNAPRLRDEDVIQVRKVFQVLANAARDAGGEWQAIVLDHASEDVWGEVAGVHLVEDWHASGSLVPEDWLTASK